MSSSPWFDSRLTDPRVIPITPLGCGSVWTSYIKVMSLWLMYGKTMTSNNRSYWLCHTQQTKYLTYNFFVFSFNQRPIFGLAGFSPPPKFSKNIRFYRFTWFQRKSAPTLSVKETGSSIIRQPESTSKQNNLVSRIFMQVFITFLHCCYPTSIKDFDLAR